MTERNFCYMCCHLKSVDALTGEKMEFGFGYCFMRPYYRPLKLLQPVDKKTCSDDQSCPYFKKRSPVEIEKIEKWMDKHGITAYVRSMA